MENAGHLIFGHSLVSCGNLGPLGKMKAVGHLVFWVIPYKNFLKSLGNLVIFFHSGKFDWKVWGHLVFFGLSWQEIAEVTGLFDIFGH